ncbi:MAG TPA: hypothetical protein ENJ51_07465 [Leucothrix mucor]|uniref:Kazal-like domain-containing protein n=1 Tax=Leucothrix mucor TaxID=45248 RepID=A0A7V2T0V6_LEUMU|nr:hypothetical protein [Leucothrix mucor]
MQITACIKIEIETMKAHLKLSIMGILSLIFLISCQDKKTVTNPKPKSSPIGTYTECKDPRPEVCTKEFRPVCSKVDTGVRCVTTPCPSTENKTYSNACTACAEPKVYGFWKNACLE